MLVAAAAVWSGVARHDEAAGLHCLHLCNDYDGRRRSIARADTFTYELNGSLAESNGGPSLVSYGGTFGSTGYTFGAVLRWIRPQIVVVINLLFVPLHLPVRISRTGVE